MMTWKGGDWGEGGNPKVCRDTCRDMGKLRGLCLLRTFLGHKRTSLGHLRGSVVVLVVHTKIIPERHQMDLPLFGHPRDFTNVPPTTRARI